MIELHPVIYFQNAVISHATCPNVFSHASVRKYCFLWAHFY